ncbi:hypothetical protein L218DRAFT_900391 [Marasmius fiardii PR-910]|nr:hypothetical protein L218DRAFT_900391 [Marasmius fiardii PR-910]
MWSETSRPHPDSEMSNSSDIVQHIAALYLTSQQVVTLPVSTNSAMFAVYGIYIVIFGLSIHVLSRPDAPGSKLYMGWTISLFVLGTLYTTTYVWGASRQAKIYFDAATTKDYTILLEYLIGTEERHSAWFAIINLVGGLMNIIADWMLIHRCYTIWQSKIILYILAFIAVVLDGIQLGCAITGTIGMSVPLDHIYAIGSIIDNIRAIAIAVFQVILALLTGGRIWWITRQARRLMGQSTDAKYNSIVAIIIESGLLYASCLVGALVISFMLDPYAHGVIPFEFGPILALMSGLAPTLVIVRVAYGKSVDSVHQVVSTLQFADAQPQGNNQSQRSRPMTIVDPTNVNGHGDLELRNESDDSEPSQTSSGNEKTMV